MSKTQHKIALTSVICAVLSLSLMTTVSAADLTPAANQPTEVPMNGSGAGSMYIVRLESPSIATYEGGIKGFAATSAKANGQTRLDTKSKAAKNYEKFLRSEQKTLIRMAGKNFGRILDTKYEYQHAINGFAVELSADEAKAMASMDGVISVQRERIEQLLTDSGPAWIGAPELWSNGNNSSMGEGMVVAILDSGINSGHPSFAAVGGDGYSHTNPLGSGNYMAGSYCDTTDASFCNDKLIGAYSFVTEAVTPEDSDGHGSHTASTVAGNVVMGAELVAPTTSVSFDITGVAPHANIIAYDVCVDGCPGAALVAAVNQVIIDAGSLPNGIAAINYSISGGGDPYNDPVELGFLAAVEAGVYVSASAGNAGPGASTVAHLGPWVSTTAASTHNRQIRNSLIDIDSTGGSAADISGLGLTAGYGPAVIINSADLEGAFPGSTLCGLGVIGDNTPPWPAGTFNGEIVVCTRGTFGRTEKGANALAAGAGGFVLIDNGGGLVGDAHVLPGVHISAADGATLSAWLAANVGNEPMASIAGYNIDLDAANGDVMGGFSSRGPQLAFDVMKPDVTAPGVDIMGAEAFGQAAASPDYQIISGTSMSSPHNAGAATLMAAAHPDWTPQEIKSAIMLSATTAYTVKEDGITPTDPFDLGAGRIELGDAYNSGLVMDESIANFEAANPDLGGDPSTLNLASMMSSSCVGTCSWTRTVTNSMNNTGHWNVTVSGFADAEVTITPNAKSKSNNLKLKSGQSATITVTVNSAGLEEGWHFGKVELDRNGNTGPDLSMPIAAFAAVASNADLFTKTVDASSATAGDTLTYEVSVTNGQLGGPITVTDVVPEGASFVAASESEVVMNGSTSSPWAYDAGSNSMSWTGELTPGGLDVSSDPGGTPFGYLPLSGFFAPLNTGCNGDCDDGGFGFNTLPFTFNGATYTGLIMSVNGTVEAGFASGGFTSFDNQDFPDVAPPNNLMAPFWRDLNQNAGGEMYFGTLGFGPVPAPNWIIAEWTDVPHFGSTDAVTMQVWIGADGTPVEGDIHYVYARMDNSAAGGTVGAENATGTQGTNYFYNGSGTAPVAGDELRVQTLAGGTATLGFQVEADCSADLIVNQADLSNAGGDEKAIAVTSCE